MPDPLAGLPPRFLRTPDAARFLGLSGRTLEKHRTYGTGPKYRKIGGRVIYALDDLKAWADLGAKTSTSDPGVATVFPAKRILGSAMSRHIGTDRFEPPAMSGSRTFRGERDQLELFRALPGGFAPRDAQDLMAYPFFSLSKSHRVTPIDFRMGEVAIRVEATAEHGMATIWDADVLIWAASQLVEARDKGLRYVRMTDSLEVLASGPASSASMRPSVGRPVLRDGRDDICGIPSGAACFSAQVEGAPMVEAAGHHSPAGWLYGAVSALVLTSIRSDDQRSSALAQPIDPIQCAVLGG